MKKKLRYDLLLNSIFALCIGKANAMISNHQIQLWKKDNYIISSSPIKIDTLDPIKSINAHSKFTLPLIFETLITTNSQQELQPALAESWSLSADGKSITITIKQNHRFSDNTEVTAQDVANSLFRLCSVNSQEYGQLRGLVGCEESALGLPVKPQIFVTGKFTIRFTIESSPTTFLYQLASPNTAIIKSAQHGLIGSGPYLVRKKRSDVLLLDKNPFYVGTIQVKNNGIVMLYVIGPDVSKALAENKIDSALMYERQSLGELNTNKYNLITTAPNITELLVFNTQRYPFNKIEIRKALAAEIYNNFNCSCIPGAHKAYGILPNGVAGSLTNMMPESLPNVAPSKIFKKFPALERDGVVVTIHQLSDLKNSCESEQIKQAAKKYNIHVNFIYHKDYSELAPLRATHNLDGFIELYVFKNREAYNIFEYFAKNRNNHANINKNEIDKMLKEATSVPSSHGRFQIYRKIAQYMQGQGMVIPLFYTEHGNLMSKCLTGISSDFNFNLFLELPKISRLKYCGHV
ncbi:ABC transporter substrate-binding protein [Legionella spiritensis]|uniref:ABC transporter substrate-binding protein n=1 Tax=Legionella spiritensis TaxID=452 RepID=UPI000F7119EF|nr:ABC transporter substrate-binding protein [Legionella spiritensis]VEG92530.1 Nickel-binding periplasmic protein precursor [Legionella spiritensis]